MPTFEEHLRGTFLEKIQEALASGNFIEPERKVVPGETIIGEMNELEKAVYTAIEMNYKERVQKLPVCDCDAACIDACACHPPISPELEQDLLTSLTVNGALEQILAALVQERLKYINENTMGFYCCRGFKLVAIPPQPEMPFIPGGFGPPDGVVPPKIGSA